MGYGWVGEVRYDNADVLQEGYGYFAGVCAERGGECGQGGGVVSDPQAAGERGYKDSGGQQERPGDSFLAEGEAVCPRELTAVF